MSVVEFPARAKKVDEVIELMVRTVMKFGKHKARPIIARALGHDLPLPARYWLDNWLDGCAATLKVTDKL